MLKKYIRILMNNDLTRRIYVVNFIQNYSKSEIQLQRK